MSSRGKIYVDYLSWLSPISAKRILLLFIISLLVLEVLLRLVNPQYSRTAVSSLHGIRTLVQQSIEYPGSKIVAVGDSTLMGGGVYDHDKTVMGLLSKSLNSEPHLFNLAIPAGDTTTSTVILDKIKKLGIKNIDQVIIEILPSKFFVQEPGAYTSKNAANETLIDLQKYIPELNFTAFGLDVPNLSLNEKVEVLAQWMLGNISMLYRHRDFFRTEYIGNYPVFWLANVLIPRFIIERLFPGKSEGTNRLGARLDDYPYKPKISGDYDNSKPIFTPHFQGDYLEKSLRIAKEISSNPPIILAFPIHYEFGRVGQEKRKYTLKALDQLHEYLNNLATSTGSKLMFVASENFQAPELWTRTSAHFNSEGSALIWKSLKPSFCQLYPSTCK
jgi:hypothetical protein